MLSWQKCLQSLGMTAIVVSPVLGVVSSEATPVRPASVAPVELSLKFPPTGNVGAPRTMGGGTRSGSSCVDAEAGKLPLTALMPTRSNVGKTVTDNPMFYWYVPPTTAKSAEFVLINEEGDEVFLETVDLSETSDVVAIQANLPQTDAGLPLVGQKYYWYFSIICNSLDRSQDQFVDGILQRTELSTSLKDELVGKSSLEQAEVYAQYQIWHEVLRAVAELREVYPDEWTELLESVGLEAIAPTISDNDDNLYPVTDQNVE